MVVGLGNPGSEYEHTRHNVGFDIVDALAAVLPGGFQAGSGGQSSFLQGRFKGRNIYLQKPLTFMNLSGKAVAWLARKKKIIPQEILLVYDEVDLPLGRIRLRRGGSSAGHRGVESVINELQSAAFARLRVGIGSGKTGQVEHVLSRFGAGEQQVWEKVKCLAVEAIVLSLSRDLTQAMNRFNGMFVSDSDEQEQM